MSSSVYCVFHEWICCCSVLNFLNCTKTLKVLILILGLSFFVLLDFSNVSGFFGALTFFLVFGVQFVSFSVLFNSF